MSVCVLWKEIDFMRPNCTCEKILRLILFQQKPLFKAKLVSCQYRYDTARFKLSDELQLVAVSSSP
jgi:hypothetical protein